MFEVILTTGLIALILLIIGFKLDDKHQVLKVFSLFFAIFCILMLSKLGNDSITKCEFLPYEKTMFYVYGDNFTGYHWDYTFDLPVSKAQNPYLFHTNETIKYKKQCYNETTSTTPSLVFKSSTWYFRIVFVYVFGFVIWLVAQQLLSLVKKMKNG